MVFARSQRGENLFRRGDSARFPTHRPSGKGGPMRAALHAVPSIQSMLSQGKHYPGFIQSFRPKREAGAFLRPIGDLQARQGPERMSGPLGFGLGLGFGFGFRSTIIVKTSKHHAGLPGIRVQRQR